MLKTLTFITFFGVAGSVIAALSINFSFSTGWIGALGLIIWALCSRKYWANIEHSTGDEPSPPERALWIQSAGYSVLLGHLVTVLLHPEINLRLGSGNTLAIDSWLMALASIVNEFIFRKDRQIQDERDARFSAAGTRSSYRALIILISFLALYIAVTPLNFRSGLSHFLLGNMLIITILASYTIQLVVRLHAYSHDRLDPSLEIGKK